MVIDIDKAKSAFNKYLKKYDISNNKISLKYYHSIRVANLCKKIALSLNLSDDKVLLAELIGLLHDIGRFEQVRLYNTYNDIKTQDHGKLGVDILFGNNFIREFISTFEYDEIIKKVILAHNKFNIPDHYDADETLYARIVRDADKIDILYLTAINEITFITEDKLLSEKVVAYILNNSQVDCLIVKNELDELALHLAFVYDLNFPYSYNYIKRENYVSIIIKSSKISITDKQVLNKINNYIDKKIIKFEGVI